MLRIDCNRRDLIAWLDTPHVIPRPDVILRVEGPGAVACLQGLFTNDVERAGDHSLTWGAVLTPKGMIISDLWLWRRATDVLVIVPAAGAEAVIELFRKSFPPRLAKVTDLRHELTACWLTAEVAAAVPDVESIAPAGPAPFRAMAIAPTASLSTIMEGAGWPTAPEVAADALALLAGWPVLGREIDARTLVQEVRFDALHAVRYDKGCFVGQETVSRLHFRGHPNRTLRAVIGRGVVPVDSIVTDGDAGREVGAAATLLACEGHWVASSKLRREVQVGDRVRIGGHDGAVHEFPITLADLA